MGAVEELFDFGNIFITDSLLLIFAALALIDNDIAMAVFVYKRIAAQPLQVALTKTKVLIQFCRFAAVTAPLVSAALKFTRIGLRISLIAMPVALQIGTR